MTKKTKWLEVAADKSSSYSWTLGSLLKDYCSLERLAQDDLAAYLGCNPESLNWLSLCRKPRSDHFVEDVTRIAKRFDLDKSKLAHIVRRIDVINDLQQPCDYEDKEPVLLAARDRQKGNSRE
jgi:hypothetical protein